MLASIKNMIIITFISLCWISLIVLAEMLVFMPTTGKSYMTIVYTSWEIEANKFLKILVNSLPQHIR